MCARAERVWETVRERGGGASRETALRGWGGAKTWGAGLSENSCTRAGRGEGLGAWLIEEQLRMRGGLYNQQISAAAEIPN